MRVIVNLKLSQVSFLCLSGLGKSSAFKEKPGGHGALSLVTTVSRLASHILVRLVRFFFFNLKPYFMCSNTVYILNSTVIE